MSVERRPEEDRPPRMAALARLPVFFALDGKRAVVTGDSPAVAWKVELLSAAGAKVDVFTETPCEELSTVAKEPPRAPFAAVDARGFRWRRHRRRRLR
jgi:uroporphyrin-III C-methyltransferase / precorrin-2 dehydrogenase / sirohydrochlorin ferrochelatase